MKVFRSYGPVNSYVLDKLRTEGMSLAKLVYESLLEHREEPWVLITFTADSVGWGWHPGEAEAFAAAPVESDDPLARAMAGPGSYDHALARLIVALGRLGLALIEEDWLSPELNWIPSGEGLRRVICGREVYYLLAEPSEQGAVDALLTGDPGVLRAFLFDTARVPEGDVMPESDLTGIAETVQAVVAGAFDGEGYLLMLPPRLYKELLSQRSS